MVYIDLKNSAGSDVGRVNLNHSSENEYSGIWNVSAGSDTYNATIKASGPDGSKAFNDVLQIIVRGSENTTGSVNVTRSKNR
jgi:archaellum component FlaG (FlaF/FlaG flagellin family)